MKFIIKHDIRGRLRIHMVQSRMSYEEADTLLYYIENLSGVTSAKVFERTCDASISYKGDRETLLQALRIFQYQTTDVPADLLAHSGRELNSTYQEKLVQKVVLRAGSKLFCHIRSAPLMPLLNPYIIYGKGSDVWPAENWRLKCWMQPPSASPYCVQILIPQALSCSCWELANFWKNGPTRNPWMTWHAACP